MSQETLDPGVGILMKKITLTQSKTIFDGTFTHNCFSSAVQHERAPRSCIGPPIPGSPFALDLCRPSAFGPGSFFMPLHHFQSHPPPPSTAPQLHPSPATTADLGSGQPPSISRYFSTLSSPYVDSAFLSRSKVSLLSESLFGRSLFSPASQSKDTFPFTTISNAKEDEVTSSESQSNESVTLTSKDAVFESAAKLLFLAIKWAKGVPSFSQLPSEDRKTLIQESWADLFVLTSAQWNFSDSSTTDDCLGNIYCNSPAYPY